jgi:hypothetical protein
MAKLTLQSVRAQHGDNSPAMRIALQSAMDTHNQYIQVQFSHLSLAVICWQLVYAGQHL